MCAACKMCVAPAFFQSPLNALMSKKTASCMRLVFTQWGLVWKGTCGCVFYRLSRGRCFFCAVIANRKKPFFLLSSSPYITHQQTHLIFPLHILFSQILSPSSFLFIFSLSLSLRARVRAPCPTTKTTNRAFLHLPKVFSFFFFRTLCKWKKKKKKNRKKTMHQ